MSRMRFCSAMVRKSYLLCTFILSRRIDDSRLVKYEFLRPHYHLHTFRLERAAEVDGQVRGWLAEAYRMGEQEHLEVGPLGRAATSSPGRTPQS
jgi:hypothetical protein